MKKQEYLGWEPYKPLIANDADLLQFLPKDKHDVDNFYLLRNLGYPVIAPVLPKLFEWVQDMNWPVAQVVAPFLASLGRIVLPEVKQILATNDGMWKYWVLHSIVSKMERDEAIHFAPIIELLLSTLTEDDVACEVDIEAKELLTELQNSTT